MCDDGGMRGRPEIHVSAVPVEKLSWCAMLVCASVVGSTHQVSASQHIAKSKTLMDVHGKGVPGHGIEFNGLVAFGSWSNPKKSFLAPAHFKVHYSYKCSAGADMSIGIDGYDG
jgi:hypothetical protein